MSDPFEISDLERLQLDVRDYLLSHAQCDPLSILSVRPRDAGEAAGIVTKLDRTLAGLVKRNGRAGVAAIVTMPALDSLEANVRALTGDGVLAIDVIENILINQGAEGTGKSCECWALLIMQILQHATFFPHNPLVMAPKPLRPIEEAIADKKVMYRIYINAPFAMPVLSKVDAPVVECADAFVTLACATPGAAIYYTLDQSFPGPGNDAALPYTAPIPLEPGTHILRTAAFAAGMAGSDAIRRPAHGFRSGLTID